MPGTLSCTIETEMTTIPKNSSLIRLCQVILRASHLQTFTTKMIFGFGCIKQSSQNFLAPHKITVISSRLKQEHELTDKKLCCYYINECEYPSGCEITTT